MCLGCRRLFGLGCRLAADHVHSINWCAAVGMELPEGVSRDAIATFLDWDAECHATREGPKGSMGWQECRGDIDRCRAVVTHLVMGHNRQRCTTKNTPCTLCISASQCDCV